MFPRFVQLPRELRDEIYRNALVVNSPIQFGNCRRRLTYYQAAWQLKWVNRSSENSAISPPKRAWGLLRASRAIRLEALEVLFKESTLSIFLPFVMSLIVESRNSAQQPGTTRPHVQVSRFKFLEDRRKLHDLRTHSPSHPCRCLPKSVLKQSRHLVFNIDVDALNLGATSGDWVELRKILERFMYAISEKDDIQSLYIKIDVDLLDPNRTNHLQTLMEPFKLLRNVKSVVFGTFTGSGEQVGPCVDNEVIESHLTWPSSQYCKDLKSLITGPRTPTASDKLQKV